MADSDDFKGFRMGDDALIDDFAGDTDFGMSGGMGSGMGGGIEEWEDSDDEANERNDESSKKRRYPNILVTGTPGVGKTSFCEAICQELNESGPTIMKHLIVNDMIKGNEKKYVESKDSDRDGCLIINEDAIIDDCRTQLTDQAKKNGWLIDTHICDIWPAHWIDLVLVLRCDNTVLYDRLKHRGYSSKKISENIEAEIMRVILDEALDVFVHSDGDSDTSEDNRDKGMGYPHCEVIELRSDSIDDMESNIEQCKLWVSSWMADSQPDSATALPSSASAFTGGVSERKSEEAALAEFLMDPADRSATSASGDTSAMESDGGAIIGGSSAMDSTFDRCGFEWDPEIAQAFL